MLCSCYRRCYINAYSLPRMLYSYIYRMLYASWIMHASNAVSIHASNCIFIHIWYATFIRISNSTCMYMLNHIPMHIVHAKRYVYWIHYSCIYCVSSTCICWVLYQCICYIYIYYINAYFHAGIQCKIDVHQMLRSCMYHMSGQRIYIYIGCHMKQNDASIHIYYILQS